MVPKLKLAGETLMLLSTLIVNVCWADCPNKETAPSSRRPAAKAVRLNHIEKELQIIIGLIGVAAFI